ncbi:MAG TPA: hypothetical protein VFQ25_17300 [Ktedonobacterales bacterium]|nr:hypothetical protein [Ktedonobacterales bacterium]
MTDRTERQKRDEAIEARDQLPEASETTPLTVEQTPDREVIAPDGRAIESAPEPVRAAKPRRATRKNAAGKSSRSTRQTTKADPEAARAAEAAERAIAVVELESQGFSEVEALRLIDISKRLESSAEAREARRLRFTRWLVEQGILDEFSA